MRKIFFWALSFCGVAVTTAAGVSPGDAVSNLSQWVGMLGISSPTWLNDPVIDETVFWAGIIMSVIGIFGVVMAVFRPFSGLQTDTVEAVPKRMPITDFLNDARKRGWDIDGNESLHILDLSKALRQAALDGALRFWGKLVDSSFESIVRHKPLDEIPREHWRKFELNAMAWRAAGDNIDAHTYNPGQTNWGANGFADIYVDEKSGKRWLKENSPPSSNLKR